LAILGLINKIEESGKKISNLHIITTPIEHDAVLRPIQSLEKSGAVVTYLPVDYEGKISLRDLKGALRKETVLVSIMYANNEIGTINSISEIGREILRWRNKNNSIYPFFHTDACQAAGYLDLNVERLHVDFLSLNGSKIYGPKGTGILYKRVGVEISPVIYGGGQEGHLRSGTPNVAGIIGFAESLSIAHRQKEKNIKKIEALRNYFWEQIQKVADGARLNGPVSNRLPNNLNVVFPEIESDEMIIYLNEQGVVCSSGSACSAESNEASHVLLSCGLPLELAKRSVRFTLGRQTTKQEIEKALAAIKKILSLHAKTKLNFFGTSMDKKDI
jgi:cysteine desulfurase